MSGTVTFFLGVPAAFTAFAVPLDFLAGNQRKLFDDIPLDVRTEARSCRYHQVAVYDLHRLCQQIVAQRIVLAWVPFDMSTNMRRNGCREMDVRDLSETFERVRFAA